MARTASGADDSAARESRRFPAAELSPQLRLQTAREYAISVFGKEVTAAAWLGRVNAAVLGGSCTVAAACETDDGFREAMMELRRIERRGQA